MCTRSTRNPEDARASEGDANLEERVVAKVLWPLLLGRILHTERQKCNVPVDLHVRPDAGLPPRERADKARSRAELQEHT